MKSSIPKPLHRLGDASMLEHVICEGKKLDPDRLIVVYNDERVKKKALDCGCETALQEQALGTADALKAAFKNFQIKGTVLVSCSDIPLVSFSVYERLYLKHVAESDYITLLAARAPDPEGYGRVVKGEKGSLRIVEEKEAGEEEKQIDLINSGIYCMEAEGLEEYLSMIKKSPVKGEYYLTDVVQIAGENAEKVGLIECEHDLIMGVNTKQNLKKAQSKLEKKTGRGNE